MSCEKSIAPVAPSEYGRRWRVLMQRERVDYRRYRAIMGVCDNTARTHLDNGCTPTAPMIAQACAAFGTGLVLRSLFMGGDE